MKIQHEAEGYLDRVRPARPPQVLSRLGDGGVPRRLDIQQSTEGKEEHSAKNLDINKKTDAAPPSDKVSDRFPEVFLDKADTRTLYLQGEALRSLGTLRRGHRPLCKVAELGARKRPGPPCSRLVPQCTGRIDLPIKALETCAACRRRPSADSLQSGLLSQRGGREAAGPGLSGAGIGPRSRLPHADR